MRYRIVVIAVLIALISAGAFALAANTSPSADSDDGEEQGTDVLPGLTEDELAFVGLSAEAAGDLADSEGRLWRVGREDGEFFALTADWVVGRVTFEIDSGVVTRASFEREETDVVDRSQSQSEEEIAQAQVIAEAVRRLLNVDNGFGADHRFTGVHVASLFDGDPGRPLGSLTLELIAAVVQEHGANVQFIDDVDGLITKLFDDTPLGVAVISIANVRLDGSSAEVELRLWCGSLCGVFVTYEAALEAGEWSIVGPVGPIAMS
jgi:hypothetical protein